MNPQEYAYQQALIAAGIADYTLQYSLLFRKPSLTLAEWVTLLEFLYPVVEAAREDSARLARRFYDFQRSLHHPLLPRHDRHLEGYSMRRFLWDMEPARARMSKVNSPRDAMGQTALQAVRAVENAGRQQIIHAVKDEPTPDIVRGWARVAVGEYTCSWCLMLVSRGPVYMDSDTAGATIDGDEAEAIYQATVGTTPSPDLSTYGAEISEYMEEWHPGCDCIVVPVYKADDWPGKSQADAALELWKEATKVAIREEDEGKVHTHGKNKGKEFTRNELALNALRRKLERGGVDPASFALAA